MRIYLSGGIAGIESPEARFIQYAGYVNGWAGVVVNPLKLNPDHPGQPCPPNALQGADGHTWACHLRVDLAEMLKCDAVAMLPEWEWSHGARLEHTVAAATGLRVFYFRGDSRLAYDSVGYPLHQVIEESFGIRSL